MATARKEPTMATTTYDANKAARFLAMHWGTFKLTDEPLTPSVASIVTAFEAILIETLEPPQNRRRGDDFTAVEYIQDIDPELREQELQSTLRSLEQKLRQAQ